MYKHEVDLFQVFKRAADKADHDAENNAWADVSARGSISQPVDAALSFGGSLLLAHPSVRQHH